MRDLLLLLLSTSSPVELSLPIPLPTCTSFSKALKKFALGEILEQEQWSGWSPEGSIPCAVGARHV